MSSVKVLSPNLNGHFETKSEEKKSAEEFRNYVDSNLQDPVANFYHENHICQTFNFVQEKKKQYSSLNHYKMSIWDAAKYLNEVVDYSDPDTELPQIIHLLQTAEAIRKAWPGEEYDWFHLVGFIHDLGKVLAHPSLFGEHQKAVVGDTFPVGCGFSPKVIFNNYFQENQDIHHPVYSTKFGIYEEGVGFENLHFSWGHDEYMFQVCVQNGCTLPEEALYVIRFHSFYAWHQSGGYEYFASEKDKAMLFWLKEFQKGDLYSKLPEKPNLDILLPYYQKLVEKYFPQEILRW